MRSVFVLETRGRGYSVGTMLRELPGVSVWEAGSMGELVHEVQTRPPDLVVADLDAGRHGSFALLESMPAAAAVFLSANVERFEARVARNPRALLLDEPLSQRALRHIVLETLRPDAPFLAADYVRLACASRRSVRITVAGTGEIYVVRGILWSASVGALRGEPALHRLAFAAQVPVRCEGGSVALPDRNLPHRSWEQQLLDAARGHDEASFELADDPAFDPDVTFDRLMEDAARALLARDFSAAIRAYEAALVLCPDDRLARSNLARLRLLADGAPTWPP